MGFFELAHLLTGFDRLQIICADVTFKHMKTRDYLQIHQLA